MYERHVHCAAAQAPGSLLIYYGWPSAINGSTTVAEAATELGRYDIVVLGDGVSKPEHPDHAKAREILQHPAVADATFFGYVDLGVSTQNLKMGAVFAAIEAWRETGVSGIFFDDFGYDFGTDRERQNRPWRAPANGEWR